jgi:hypothetical protein
MRRRAHYHQASEAYGMQVSERFLAEELDRVILSIILRTERLCIHLTELMVQAQSILAAMDQGLELMRVRHARLT